MKDILEYNKQAPNDYPFVYQDTMERVFAEDFNKTLVEYEDRLLKNISNYGPDYNIIRKDVRYRRPSSYERFYTVDSSDIHDVLAENFVRAYKVGGQQGYKDFGKDIEFNLGVFDIDEIALSVGDKVGAITNSYKNLVLSKLRVAFNRESSFRDFYSDLLSYKDFQKADPTYTTPMPSKKNMVDNYATREITRNVFNGRMSAYGNTKRIATYIYKTRADERVSSICAPFHNQVFQPDQVQGLIPKHRNCRCTVVPNT